MCDRIRPVARAVSDCDVVEACLVWRAWVSDERAYITCLASSLEVM